MTGAGGNDKWKRRTYAGSDPLGGLSLPTGVQLRCVRQLLVPANSKMFCYCFVPVNGTGVTVVPVIVFPSAETVAL
jgi:hypothetical protein